ncbi:MAG: DegT/DnrJ/EryC1/StrS family aminotransferase, partial [Candidatus Brocadiales bacterium]
MRIPVCEPEIGKEEIKNVLLCLKDKQISGTGGTYVSEFEDKFSNYCNAKYGIATSSGTTAIHLALAAIGIKKGDEVIVSNLTNIATVYGVVYSGATPVLVDCERKTWNIDPAQIQDKITKRTRAIMVVHLYGHPVDMTPVLNIARKHGLYLIEDAAESHGAEYRGKRVGCLGDIGCFSFYANKIITTGEGGMVVTKNRDIYERAQLLKNLAFSRKRRFFHYHIGFNYRMTNIQAAMGLAQLERIGEILKKKIYNAQVYNSLLDGTDGIVLPPSEPWA